jgi:WD40 repeat protein
MAGVFISYSRHDKDFADYIAEELRQRDFEVFIDYQRLLGGESWVERLGHEIDKREYVVFILSRRSVRSEWVQDEIAYARRLNKPIIPVIMERIKDSDWSKFFFLVRREHIDFTPWYTGKKAEDAVQKLVASLGRSILLEADSEKVLTPDNAVGIQLQTTFLPLGYKGADGIAFSPDGSLFAVALDDEIHLLRVMDWDEVAVFSIFMEIAVKNLAFSPDGSLLGAAGSDSKLKIWSVPQLLETVGQDARREANKFRSSVATLDARRGITGTSRFAFSPDGHVLAWACGADVEIWDVRRYSKSGTLKGSGGNWFTRDGLFDVAFSPDGGIVAAASGDKTVKLWNARSSNAMGVLSRHSAEVTCVAFSPDGQVIASGARDATVALWDVSRQQEIGTLIGHANQILTIAFSPDGRLLASASVDGTGRLWDVMRQREVNHLRHNMPVGAITFSPDGTLLVSNCRHHGTCVWGIV